MQNARLGAADMESSLKNYLALKNPGKMPYLGVVHRLDQPVEGVLVFAKNTESGIRADSTDYFKNCYEEYLAVTVQMSDEKQGHLEDYLKKDSRTNSSSVIASKTPGAKKAVLDYWVQEEIKDERTETGKRILVKIALDTGRHHQIRVQMAHKGMPLLGDRKYNAKDLSGLPLGLCSCHLAFRHPVTGKKMEFKAAPKGEAFTGFQTL